MKRVLQVLILLLGIAISASCTKNNPTTYTVKCSVSTASDATMKLDIVAFEYNEEGEIVGQNTMKEVYTGTTKTFTAGSRAVKVKLYLVLSKPNSSAASEYLWVKRVFYLENGTNITIELKDDTIMSANEP